MAFTDDFTDLCVQDIVWEPLASRDQYGKPVYGTPQMFVGRRTYKINRIAGFSRTVKGEGADVVSESQILILAVVNVKYEDRVYVSGDAVFPPVVSVEGVPDETGVNQYTKILLGNADG